MQVSRSKVHPVFVGGRRWYDSVFEKLVIVGGWLAFIRVLDSVMQHAH